MQWVYNIIYIGIIVTQSHYHNFRTSKFHQMFFHPRLISCVLHIPSYHHILCVARSIVHLNIYIYIIIFNIYILYTHIILTIPYCLFIMQPFCSHKIDWSTTVAGGVFGLVFGPETVPGRRRVRYTIIYHTL